MGKLFSKTPADNPTGNTHRQYDIAWCLNPNHKITVFKGKPQVFDGAKIKNHWGGYPLLHYFPFERQLISTNCDNKSSSFLIYDTSKPLKLVHASDHYLNTRIHPQFIGFNLA